MKKRENIGITRTLDKCGRVCLPIEFRKELGIDFDDFLELKLVLIDNNKKIIEVCKKEK